jgi:hypothetical protein
MLGPGENIRLTIVSTGGSPVFLNTRQRAVAAWTRTTAKLVARKSYEATLGPFTSRAEFVEYFVSAGNLVTPTCVITIT